MAFPQHNKKQASILTVCQENKFLLNENRQILLNLIIGKNILLLNKIVSILIVSRF